MKAARPDSQGSRIDSLKKELADISTQFDAFVSKELASINKSLAQKKMEPFNPSHAQPGKLQSDEGSGGRARPGSPGRQWEIILPPHLVLF